MEEIRTKQAITLQFLEEESFKLRAEGGEAIKEKGRRDFQSEGAAFSKDSEVSKNRVLKNCKKFSRVGS